VAFVGLALDLIIMKLIRVLGHSTVRLRRKCIRSACGDDRDKFPILIGQLYGIWVCWMQQAASAGPQPFCVMLRTDGISQRRVGSAQCTRRDGAISPAEGWPSWPRKAKRASRSERGCRGD
jgi:hypothetical protein